MKQGYCCKDYLKNQNDEKSAKSYSLWEDKYKNVAYFILLWLLFAGGSKSWRSFLLQQSYPGV